MILLATNEFPPVAGGVGTYCYEMCWALHRLGEPVAVVAAQKLGHNAQGFDRHLPFVVWRVPEYSQAPLRHGARLATIASAMAQTHPRILWTADWRSAIGLLPLLGRRRALAVMAHGSDVLIAASSALRRRVAKLIYRRAGVVLTNSNYTRGLLHDLGVPDEKIVVTSLGVDPAAWEERPERTAAVRQRHGLAGRRVILSLARLTPRKGQDVLIRAMPAVLQCFPNAICVLAGAGDDEQRLRQIVAELSLESSVVFAGFVEEAEKAAYYHACDIYTILSRREGLLVEGFGITLLEAAACGKPVVAGDHGGVAEAVVAGETGLLVDPLDPAQVAAALRALLADPAWAAAIGQRARQRVAQSQTWAAVARRTLDSFARL